MIRNKCILALILGVCLFLPFKMQALGISPAAITIDNVGPDNIIEKTLYISRSQYAEAETAKIYILGTAAPYLSLPGGEDLILPAGQQTTPFTLVLSSGSLAAGDYQATITVNKQPNENIQLEQGSAGSLILEGTQGQINFTVINSAVESYTIQDVSIADTEEGQPLGFSFIINNTGNVDARPTSIDFLAVDQQDPENTYHEIISEADITITPAFQTMRVDFQLAGNPLKQGNYKVTITFYHDDTVIYQIDSLGLQVFPPGTLQQAGLLNSFATDKSDYQSGEIVKFIGRFQNSGTIGLEASLVTEIFYKDERIEVIKEDPLFIPINALVDLESLYTPAKGGDYTAQGYVSFGPYKTEVLEAQFKVKEVSPWLLIIILAGATIVAGALLFLLYRVLLRRRRTAAPNLPPKE